MFERGQRVRTTAGEHGTVVAVTNNFGRAEYRVAWDVPRHGQQTSVVGARVLEPVEDESVSRQVVDGGWVEITRGRPPYVGQVARVKTTFFEVSERALLVLRDGEEVLWSKADLAPCDPPEVG